MLLFAVDDEKPILEGTKEILLEACEGAEVMTFSRGDAALEAISQGKKPDVVFSDIEMPGLSGLEFAVRLKSLSPETKIVFVTGYDKYAVNAFKIKANGYLLKPISVEDVREELSYMPEPREADKDKLCEILPNTRLYFAYGSSEAGCVSMYDYSKNRGLISCVGKPNKNANIFIVDDNRNPIKSSKENQGLIAISGGMVMQGYYNAPELTEGVLKDGVVYTNDIGYIDDEGYVYMLGRKGDVINIGGLKIAPTEVENVVLRYPDIADCACFAVEDRMGGVVPKLNVVMKKGCELDTAALRAHMAKHLEAFKIPKQIVKVDELPKTSNGKLDRKNLK